MSEFRLAPQEYDPAIPLDTLTEYPGNPNMGAAGVIVESLEAHGFYGAIIVQRSTRHVLAGNHRYRLAREAGASTLPGFWMDVDDEEAARLVAIDNHSARLGRDDEALLVALLTSLPDLTGTGYPARDLDDMIARQSGLLTRGELLELAGVTVGEPTHQVMDGQLWRLAEGVVLAVCDLHTGWHLWGPLLDGAAPETVFLPYPTPMAPHGAQGPVVMVQPDTYLAGHLLDKWESLTGTPPVLVMGP